MAALYLCEKPDQGRAVARGLGGGTDRGDHIECAGGDLVGWGFGHLLSALEPEDYDPAFGPWDWATLPVVPDPFRYKPKDARAAKQLRVLADLLRKASEVVISTDADREGELIAYLILLHLKWRGPTKRLWLSDLTQPAVERALAALRPASATKPLYLAASARSMADWIVGMNLTRGVTLRFREGRGKPFSIGRVQTPTLALIVRNERRILGFKPQDYHELLAEVLTAGGHRLVMRYAPAAGQRILDPAEAAGILAKAQGAKGPLSVKTEAKTQAPPSLFDLNLLQQEANSRFGWSGKKTLDVAQKLYEKHKYLTYPRTDSTALPAEHSTRIPGIAANLSRIPELAHLPALLASPLVRPTVYDDAGVKSHHAIVPTLEPPDPSHMDADEAALFALVARRWAAAHMPDHGFLETVVELDANGVPLRVAGRVPTKDGWKAAMKGGAPEEPDEEEEDDAAKIPEKTLPPVADKEAAHVNRAKIEVKQTKPPRRFTEKSLLGAMKDIGSYVEDPDARARLRKSSGIGTSATRAGIIETLKSRGYIEVKKRLLVPTEVGMGVIGAMEASAPSYCDPAETAAWEDVLEDIAEGRAMPDAFVSKIAAKVRADLASVKGHSGPTLSISSGPKGPPRPTFATQEDRAAAIKSGTVLKVPFDKKDKAKALGAAWDADRRVWIALLGTDLAPFKRAKFV